MEPKRWLSWLEAFNESSASPGSIPGAYSISVHSAREWGEKLLSSEKKSPLEPNLLLFFMSMNDLYS
jgi:hypothetical protein